MPAPNSLDRGRLTALAEWQHLEKRAEQLIERYRDELEESPSWDKSLFVKGVIKGIRAFLALPEEVFLTEEELAERQKQQTSRAVRQVGQSWEPEEERNARRYPGR